MADVPITETAHDGQQRRSANQLPDNRVLIQPVVLHRQERPCGHVAPMLFEQAVDLGLRGFAVFPLRPRTKTPLIKNWEQRASTDPRRIARWWVTHPHANIGIACGPSGLLVIDLDAAKKPGALRHGQQTLTALAAGRAIPRTFTVASARGGRHLYYRQPEGAALRSTIGSDRAGLGPLIDTRGHGGYVVAPGSIFNGGSYRMEREAPVALLPSWIAGELTTRSIAPAPTTAHSDALTPVTDQRRTAYGNAALHRSADAVATAPEGTRNNTLNREAFRLGRLVGGAILDHDDAMTALRRAARKTGLPPAEIEKTITSGLTAGMSQPRSIPDRAPPPQTSHPTKEVPMKTATAQAPHTAIQGVTAPPNAANLYPLLAAPGSHAFQEALRALWRLGPEAIGLPTTHAEPVRAAWQRAGEQMAAAIHERDTTGQQFGSATAEPGLREAYINARNQVNAHATSHEWQEQCLEPVDRLGEGVPSRVIVCQVTE